MAIGARILSNNLSGQTVNVTFLPTTGGTINLGTQTIPFNNITSYPYGLYQIYVPLYDYTYELTINPPTNVKSFTFLSKLITNNNYGDAVLDFNDLTAEVLDLNIDVTGWYINGIYPITDSGYVYFFNNNNDGCLKWVLFVDAKGDIMDNYQVYDDCDDDYDNLSGKWITYSDYYNGVFKYFNGVDVYTLTADTSYQYIYSFYNGSGVMSNNNFVIAIENFTANTANTFIVNGPVLIPFGDTFDYSTKSYSVYTYFDGNFIQIFEYDNIIDQYTSIKIYDGNSGTLLHDVDLTTYGIMNSYDFRFFGNNKSLVIFWNYADNTVDYTILQYNGNTDVLNIETHDRVNYPDISVNANNNLFPNDGGSESFSILLYSASSWNDVGTVVTYCDILYMISGDTSIQTYNFQNSGLPDKTIRNYVVTSNNIFTNCDNGDGYVSVISITNTGVTFHNTGLLMSNLPSANDMVSCGDGYVASFYEDTTHTIMSLIYILQDGTLGDLINGITLTGAYQRGSDYVGDVYQFRTYSTTNYFICSAYTTFQTGVLAGNNINTYYPTDKFRPNFKRPGLIASVNTTTKECTILSSSGVTSVFTLPAATGFNFSFGDTMFAYSFVDTVSGLTNIHLYDFDFNLITSAVTEYNSIWGLESCGDNFTLIIFDSSKYHIYLIKDSTIIQTSLTDYDSYYTYNDYIWWD